MNTDFGPRIKHLRTQKGMTQLELAKRLGVSKTIMSAYETGLRKRSYDVLMEIVLFFNVSMNWMFDSGDGNINLAKIDISNLTNNQQHLLHQLIDEIRDTDKNPNAHDNSRYIKWKVDPLNLDKQKK